MTISYLYGYNILPAITTNANGYRALYNTATAMMNANIAAGNARMAKHFENIAFSAMLRAY